MALQKESQHHDMTRELVLPSFPSQTSTQRRTGALNPLDITSRSDFQRSVRIEFDRNHRLESFVAGLLRDLSVQGRLVIFGGFVAPDFTISCMATTSLAGHRSGSVRQPQRLSWRSLANEL